MNTKSLYRRGATVLWAAAILLVLVLLWPYRAEILTALQTADHLKFLNALLWYLAALTLSVTAWIVIVRPFTPGISTRDHIRIYCVTLISRRLPGTIWYVVGRMTLYKHLGVRRTDVTYASSLELVVSFTTAVLLSVVFLPGTLFSRFGDAVPTYALALLVLAGLGLIASPRAVLWLAKRFKLPIPPRLSKRSIALGMLVYLGMWTLSGLMLGQIAAAFQPIPAELSGYVIGTMAFSSAMGTLATFLPSNFGISDFSIGILLVQVLTVTAASLTAIMARVLGTLFDLLAAVFFLPWYRRQARLLRDGETA